MASVYSSTSSTSSTSSIRGYGGLASGLDTDSLIESMTYATRAKIAKQKQKVQSYEWKQEATRSISDKLVTLSRSYTSYTSSTNLSSTNFWAKSDVSTVGKYKSYVSATGSSSSVDSVSILGVKQLAKQASMSSSSTVSDGALITGDINILDSSGNQVTESVSNLEGQSLTFKYGSTKYSVSLGTGTSTDGYTYDYSTGDSAVESITKSLQKISMGDGKTLADVISVTASSSGSDYTLNMKSTDTAGNTIKITGGSQTALEALGIVATGGSIDDLSDSDKTITSDGFSSTITGRQDLFTDKTFAERVGGKNVKFTYNGTASTLTFMTQSELEEKLSGLSSKTNADALKVVADDLQTKLNKAYGTGRISVSVDGDQLSFKTTDPSSGKDDTSSILTITSGSTGVVGKTGALKVNYGESNRLNLSSTLADSGLKGITTALSGKKTDATYFTGAYKALEAMESLGSKISDSTSFTDLKKLIKSNNSGLTDTEISKINQAIDYFDTEGGASTVSELKTSMGDYVEERQLNLTINGEEIKGLSYSSTLSEIINAVNTSDAGVTMSYMSTTDKFSLVSTAGGVAGDVKIEGSDAAMLFGTKGTDYTVTAGQDAIISVKYDGSDEVVELTRGSNSFNMDGLTVAVTGTFGYEYVKDSTNGNYVLNDDGSYSKIADTTKLYNEDGTEATDGAYVKTEAGDLVKASNGIYSSTAKNNTDVVTFDATVDSDAIVDAVSAMIDSLNEIITEVNDQVSKKPDRDYQPLTDEQKEEMTEDQITAWEAKAKAGNLFADSDLRTLSDNLRSLLSNDYNFKNSLSTYGISVSDDYSDNGKLVLDEATFTAALKTNADDIKALFTDTADDSSGSKGGLMARISTITEKYASTSGATKGILIESAGSTYAPNSILSNYMQTRIDDLNDYIERLQDKLETEQDRYISQFSNLETTISQLNSQSSWLSSSTSSS